MERIPLLPSSISPARISVSSTTIQQDNSDSRPPTRLPDPGTFDYLCFIRDRFSFWLRHHWVAVMHFENWRRHIDGELEYLYRARLRLMEEFEREESPLSKPSGDQPWLDELPYQFQAYTYKPGHQGFGYQLQTEFQDGLHQQWNAAAAKRDKFLCRIAREDLAWIEKSIEAVGDMIGDGRIYEYAPGHKPPKSSTEKALDSLGKRIDDATEYIQKRLAHEERESRPAAEHDVTTSDGQNASSGTAVFPFTCSADGVSFAVSFKKTKQNFLFRIDHDWTIAECRLGEASGSTTILIPDVRLDWSKFSCPRCRETARGGFCCGCYWCGTACRKCKATLSGQPKIHRVTGEKG